MNPTRRRARWLGLAATTVIALGGAGSAIVAASGAATPSSFVPITPCRLVDTRASETVGARSTPLGPNEVATFQVTGTNGNCTIPAGATGIASNVTVVNPTASSFLTVYPADAARPLAANLNWTPQSSPTPNQVTVQLSPNGSIDAYNLAGKIDVVIDVVGYYVAGGSGSPGATGAAGPRGASAWEQIPSGTTVTGEIYFNTWAGNTTDSWTAAANLPGRAPVDLTDATVSFAPHNGVPIVDADPSCSGDEIHPTAPKGKVCVYYVNGWNLASVGGYVLPAFPGQGFGGLLKAAAPGQLALIANWAYTAP